MTFTRYLLSACLGSLLFCCPLHAQQPSSTASSARVPHLVSFSGRATDARGEVISGIAGATFAIYREETEGSPLWLETQNIQADDKGHYSVQLGVTKPDGLPLDLFSSGEARWLGVTINGGEEQPRVLLVSVPYALKAADAETVGGLPPSAFVLASQAQGNAASTKTVSVPSNTAKGAAPAANPAVTGKGVINFIPLWDTTSDISDSVMFQKNSQIGINSTAPAATLDVNGKGDVRDTLTLFPKGTDATLAINGTAFKLDQKGKVTFVSGQSFPGAGTITNVVAGTDLTGGGSSGKVTLNLDTSKVPQLNSINTFAGNQEVIGTLTATGRVGAGTASPATTLDVFSTSNPNGPIAQLGSNGVSDSSSAKIYNGTGITETFQAGCIGCFVPGTQVGDGGMQVFPGKNIVFGDQNAGRLTFDSAGNASQVRTGGGMLKAMVYYSFNNGGKIISCFNSTLSGGAATVPPCGFATSQFNASDAEIDFGFQVDDRFFSFGVSGVGVPHVCTDTSGGDPEICPNIPSLTPNQVELTSGEIGFGNKAYLMVY